MTTKGVFFDDSRGPTMTAQSQIGWLYSLAADLNSNWAHVHCFHDLLTTMEDPIVISSEVWGRKKRKAFDPQPGDGFALYHSSSADFPADDPFKKNPRISVIGELVHIESEGVKISRLEIRVDRADLLALKETPIVRDERTKHIFERCEIVRGFPASLYRADRTAWAEIIALLNQRRRRVVKAVRP